MDSLKGRWGPEQEEVTSYGGWKGGRQSGVNFPETEVPHTELHCSGLRTGAGLAWDFFIPREAGRSTGWYGSPRRSFQLSLISQKGSGEREAFLGARLF